jgi:ATP-dependent Clp protease ATP-binding subunit ClpC
VLEGYSAQARRAVSLATAEARRLHHPRVGTEHLLLGVLTDDASAAAQALHAAGARLAAARHKVVEACGADAGERPTTEPEYTPRAQRALERAARFARQDREPEVRTEHVLLGILDVEGLACQVLRGLGVDVARLRDGLVEPRPDGAAPTADDEPREAPAIAPLRPRCPSCTTSLDESLTTTVVAARRPAGGTASVRIVYCGTCATALGVLPHAAG